MEVNKNEHFVYDNNSTETTVTIFENEDYAIVRWDISGNPELNAHYNKKCDKFINLSGPFGEKIKNIVGEDYKRFKALSKIVDSGLNKFRIEMLNQESPHIYTKDGVLDRMKQVRNKPILDNINKIRMN